VMTGFQGGVREKVFPANPHMLVYQSAGSGLVDPSAVVARIATVPGVRSATPFVHQQALFTTSGGGSHGGLVRGIDLHTPAVVQDIRSQLRSGSLQSLENGEPALLLGRELARALGVLPGATVTGMPPTARL